MSDVDEMSEAERFRYWMTLAQKSWFTPKDGVEIVDLQESEDKRTLTVTLRKEA